MDNQPPTQDAADTGSAEATTPADAGLSTAAEIARHRLELFQKDTIPAKPALEDDDGVMVVQRSKHQLYMDALKSSGKTMAEIQSAWHHYYNGLTDDEKHEVWREFYEADKKAVVSAKPVEPVSTSANFKKSPAGAAALQSTVEGVSTDTNTSTVETSGASLWQDDDKPRNSVPEGISQQADERLPAAAKAQLVQAVKKRGKSKLRQHLQSLLFGLACGVIVVVVVLFSFFNEVIIAPFIQPSRTVNNTPIIIGTDGVAPTDKAEVIIPKINVEIPLDFSAKTLKEEDIQKGLENGVVHYPSTPLPGQIGNTAFFGHSSNNIFNSGKYKFAFVLLHELVVGDTFYLTRNGVAYAYQVFDRKIVDPSNVNILNPIAGKAATATLITCDPPGTTTHRLVVVGEQVSPAPVANTPGGIQTAKDSGAKALPGNGPTLWQRFKKWFH